MARGGRQGLLHAVGEKQAVGQTGEHVMISLVNELLVQLLALGDVLGEGKARLAPFEHDAVRCGFDLNSSAVLLAMGPGTGDEGGFALAGKAAFLLSSVFRRKEIGKGEEAEFPLR